MTADLDNDRAGLLPEQRPLPNQHNAACDPKCTPAPKDDDEPAKLIFDQRRVEKFAQISAEQRIADATDEMYSDEPEKEKKREEIVKKYKSDVASETAGNVRQKFDAAMAPFKSALDDLICSDPEPTRLADWLGRQLKSNPPKSKESICEPLDKALYKLFFTRKQANCRLENRLGDRERRVQWSRRETLRWAAAFKAWSEPGKSIEAVISIKDTDAIYAGILAGPRDADYAIYRLLFEVAPRLLSVAVDKLPIGRPPKKEAGDAIASVSEALKDFPERQDALVIGAERKNETIYLIDGNQLDGHRMWVLDQWIAAVGRQADAEAAFSLRPDDAASLEPKLKKLIDSEAEDAKAALTSPSP